MLGRMRSPLVKRLIGQMHGFRQALWTPVDGLCVEPVTHRLCTARRFAPSGVRFCFPSAGKVL